MLDRRLTCPSPERSVVQVQDVVVMLLDQCYHMARSERPLQLLLLPSEDRAHRVDVRGLGEEIRAVEARL